MKTEILPSPLVIDGLIGKVKTAQNKLLPKPKVVKAPPLTKEQQLEVAKKNLKEALAGFIEVTEEKIGNGLFEELIFQLCENRTPEQQYGILFISCIDGVVKMESLWEKAIRTGDRKLFTPKKDDGSYHIDQIAEYAFDYEIGIAIVKNRLGASQAVYLFEHKILHYLKVKGVEVLNILPKRGYQDH